MVTEFLGKIAHLWSSWVPFWYDSEIQFREGKAWSGVYIQILLMMSLDSCQLLKEQCSVLESIASNLSVPSLLLNYSQRTTDVLVHAMAYPLHWASHIYRYT